MNRSELTEKLFLRFRNLKHEDAKMSVGIILEGIASTLSKYDRVEIRGFGSFTVNIRPPKKARNPKTGDTVFVPEKPAPHFKAGLELKDRVNQA
jgi:integration host factor subunit beta